MSSYILVVDDDPAVAQGVATLLEQAGHETRVALNAARAKLLLGRLPQLVVLDVMLPDQDGFALCRYIRQLPAYIPVLMLTALDDVADKVHGLDLGADEYVTKPFEPRELVARVRAMLRFAAQRVGREAPIDDVVKCGPLTIWPAQHRVAVQGQPVELTPREWTLLELLVQHPGQVFGRETLFRRVWGCDYLGDSRVVDVHVQRLRAKLEWAPTVPRCIETVRGFGYRLVPVGEHPDAQV